METRMVSSRSTLFGFVVALVMASQANAQESQQTWRITSPAGRPDIYNTQQDAVAAFATLPEPMPDVYTGGWPLAKQIKDQVISENGDMTLTYWLGKEPPKDPDWRYVAAPPDLEFVTE